MCAYKAKHAEINIAMMAYNAVKPRNCTYYYVGPYAFKL